MARCLVPSLVLGVVGAGSAAAGALPVEVQGCLLASNAATRQIAKAQHRVTGKCLAELAAGRLVGQSVFECLVADRGGKLAAATNKVLTAMATRCAGITPAFGLASPETVATETVGSELAILADTLGVDVASGAIPVPEVARCQARVAGALARCSDERRKEYARCLSSGLRSGAIVDATTLASACVGEGDAAQPDPRGRLANACRDRVVQSLSQGCAAADVAAALSGCALTSDRGVACVTRSPACRVCQAWSAVDGLERDCDRFDDGDGLNGSCGRECGDGVLQEGEPCDDGGGAAGDGCAADCSTEEGWVCTGSPSVCRPSCGNGTLDAGETCDDHDAIPGDGCSDRCQEEPGWRCGGIAGPCTPWCGDGVVSPSRGEACDDGNRVDDDGCSSACAVESAWSCQGQPSACIFHCGNGTFEPGESCDDRDAAGGDGCDAICRVEPGWQCTGRPSVCLPVCGDGRVRGGETCDDAGLTGGDGCSAQCVAEPGFACSHEPSDCVPRCGDGFLRGLEACDDRNAGAGDGCSASCLVEPAFGCAGQPSVCAVTCGNGQLDQSEGCDDGNLIGGDGCDASCRSEPGWSCSGSPSGCTFRCGNRAIDAGEACDDGNRIGFDGCSASCEQERAWACHSVGLPCVPLLLSIDTPGHGAFTTQGAVSVAGRYAGLLPGRVAIAVNGTPADQVNESLGTFVHTEPLSAAALANPIVVTLTNLDTGDVVEQRIVVFRGPSIGAQSVLPRAVALRLNDGAFDPIEPIVSAQLAAGFDLARHLPAGTVIKNTCKVDLGPFGCAFRVRAVVRDSPTTGPPLVTFSATPSTIDAIVTIPEPSVKLQVKLGQEFCNMRVFAQAARVRVPLRLAPRTDDASLLDVDVDEANVGVEFTGFGHQNPDCDSLTTRQLLLDNLPNLPDEVGKRINEAVKDPEVELAIERGLNSVSVVDEASQVLGVDVDASLSAVRHDAFGLTIEAGTRFTAVPGDGCTPPFDTPVPVASYAPPAAPPAFGPLRPVDGEAYDVGAAVTPGAVNQLLRAGTTCGVLQVPAASEVSKALLTFIGAPGLRNPAFLALPDTDLRIDVFATIPPMMTGRPGPHGEPWELLASQVWLSVVDPETGVEWIGAALDLRLGLNVEVVDGGAGLRVVVSPPGAADVDLTLVNNAAGVRADLFAIGLTRELAPFVDRLNAALSAFPLPSLLGLGLRDALVVREETGALSLFTRLLPVAP